MARLIAGPFCGRFMLDSRNYIYQINREGLTIMTKTKTASQPWAVSKLATPDYAPQFGLYCPDNGRDAAIVLGPNAAADATLMAAAPALCGALIDLLAVAISRGEKLGLDDGGPVLDKARAALALALSMD